MAASKKTCLDSFIGFVLLILILLVVLQTFARYILHFSLPWVEEVAIYLLLLMTFLGAALGLKDWEHVTIRVLLDRLPTTLERSLHFIFIVLILVFLYAVFRGSLVLITLSWHTPSNSVRWLTVGHVYLILPAAIGIMTYYLVLQFKARVKAILRREDAKK